MDALSDISSALINIKSNKLALISSVVILLLFFGVVYLYTTDQQAFQKLIVAECEMRSQLTGDIRTCTIINSTQ